MEVTPSSSRRSRAIDPQVRPLRWAGKAHSREGRLFIALRAELVSHVGGKPNAAKRALINRVAMLQTHLARMDERMFRAGGLSDHAARPVSRVGKRSIPDASGARPRASCRARAEFVGLPDEASRPRGY